MAGPNSSTQRLHPEVGRTFVGLSLTTRDGHDQ
jgi:hypothetical protein